MELSPVALAPWRPGDLPWTCPGTRRAAPLIPFDHLIPV